jgi:Na+/H+-dicarboxylate symporter
MTLVFAVYPLFLFLMAPGKLKHFFRSVYPAQLLAFSTSSSAATLPMTMKCCEENLKLSPSVSRFVLPVGATINMDGTCLYQSVATIFIAQAFGIPLDITTQLAIIFTATMASIGSAAVPGAGMIMLVLVLQSAGLPVQGISLILAVDRILDMFRTVVNVTSDSVVATILDRKFGKTGV